MSWSLEVRCVKKSELREALEIVVLPEYLANDGPMLDQVHAAFDAADLLAKSIPGPYISATFSGHANGVGWQKKEGMANDYINVTVMQICEDDLKFYRKEGEKENV